MKGQHDSQGLPLPLASESELPPRAGRPTGPDDPTKAGLSPFLPGTLEAENRWNPLQPIRTAPAAAARGPL